MPQIPQNCCTFAGKGSFYMRDVEVHSCPELMGLIQEVGFLPLLDSGIVGYSAEAIVDDECRYVVYSDGGWGWSLLTTPEALYGRDACQCVRTPEESYQRIFDHLRQLLPEATERQIRKLI